MISFPCLSYGPLENGDSLTKKLLESHRMQRETPRKKAPTLGQSELNKHSLVLKKVLFLFTYWNSGNMTMEMGTTRICVCQVSQSEVRARAGILILFSISYNFPLDFIPLTRVFILTLVHFCSKYMALQWRLVTGNSTGTNRVIIVIIVFEHCQL